MKLNKISLAILAAMLAVTAVNAQTSPVSKKPAVENIYTEEKLNILVDAKHPEFVIKLKSNPTTGYAWFLREYDANVITPVKHDFEQPAEKLIGASGYELWTFRVKPSGFAVPQQTTLRFIYARPWQGADSSSQLVFRVTTGSHQ